MVDTSGMIPLAGMPWQICISRPIQHPAEWRCLYNLVEARSCGICDLFGLCGIGSWTWWLVFSIGWLGIGLGDWSFQYVGFSFCPRLDGWLWDNCPLDIGVFANAYYHSEAILFFFFFIQRNLEMWSAAQAAASFSEWLLVKYCKLLEDAQERGRANTITFSIAWWGRDMQVLPIQYVMGVTRNG